MSDYEITKAELEDLNRQLNEELKQEKDSQRKEEITEQIREVNHLLDRLVLAELGRHADQLRTIRRELDALKQSAENPWQTPD